MAEMTAAQVEALLDLIKWTAAENEAATKRKAALIHAQATGASWNDLGMAMGMPRESARARWKAAVKAAEEDAQAAQEQAASTGQPVEPTPETPSLPDPTSNQAQLPAPVAVH